jgi:hypothetical protein
MAMRGVYRINKSPLAEHGVWVIADDDRTGDDRMVAEFEIPESMYHSERCEPPVETLPWESDAPSGVLRSAIAAQIERETGYRLPTAGSTRVGVWPQQPDPQDSSADSKTCSAQVARPVQAAEAVKTVFIQCPKCGKPSENIKRYKMPDIVVFFLIFAWGRRATYTACGGCMRQIIGEKMLINLVTANLAWPLLAFFWIGKFVSSYSKGHSQSVLEEVTRQSPPTPRFGL